MFHFIGIIFAGPLQINDDRIPEWELPRSYPVGYRSVHPEYIPRHPLPSQPSQTCYLPNTPNDWNRDTSAQRSQKLVKSKHKLYSKGKNDNFYQFFKK